MLLCFAGRAQECTNVNHPFDPRPSVRTSVSITELLFEENVQMNRCVFLERISFNELTRKTMSAKKLIKNAGSIQRLVLGRISRDEARHRGEARLGATSGEGGRSGRTLFREHSAVDDRHSCSSGPWVSH